MLVYSGVISKTRTRTRPNNFPSPAVLLHKLLEETNGGGGVFEFSTYDFLQQFVEENGGGSVEVYRVTASDCSISGNHNGYTCSLRIPAGGTWYITEGYISYSYGGATNTHHSFGAQYVAGGATLTSRDSIDMDVSLFFASTNILLIKVS